MDSVIQQLRHLIAFPTVSKDSNLPLIDYVEEQLHQHQIPSRRVYNSAHNKANLFCTIGPQEQLGVVLSGHSDVVPIDNQPWDSDPFELTEREGKYFGRGTCDMKAFLAIILAKLPNMKALHRPLHLVVTYDEEIGCLGAPSAIQAMQQEIAPPLGVIVGEPTEMTSVTAHKGIVVCRTKVRGWEAHSSQTHLGVSAVMVAAQLIQFLGNLAQNLAQRAPQDNGFEPAATTIHVGTIRGGMAVNIMARDCEFMWDIRHLPHEDPQSILQEFSDFTERVVLPQMRAIHPTCKVQTEMVAQAPGLAHHEQSPITELVQQLTNDASTNRVAYAAEAGQFQAAGWATVLCGPGSIRQAHQPNEFISQEQLQRGSDFLDALIEHLSR